ncbi:ion transporter [Myroides sp. LJL119]
MNNANTSLDPYNAKHPIRYKIYTLLNIDSKTLASKIVMGIIVVVILLNAATLILQSVSSLQADFGVFFDQFSFYSVLFFTLEYILRMWSITCDPNYRKPFVGRLRYGITAMQVIDLLAIAPFYLSFVYVDLRILRLLRVFRLLRIFKVARYVTALNLLVRVLRRKRDELILVFVILIFLLIIASTAMYYCENAAQPTKFSSIPESMWWAIITLTSVGYGDIVPITVVGRIVGGIISVIGVAFFAIPTGILASGFSQEFAVIPSDKQLAQPDLDIDLSSKQKPKSQNSDNPISPTPNTKHNLDS